jgi:predicted nucleic acid-binding protein
VIFVDAGPWIVLDARGDYRTPRAVKGFAKLLEIGGAVTTDLVIAEVGTLIKRHAPIGVAAARVQTILVSPKIEIVSVRPEDRMEGLRLFRQFQHVETISWCDCVSFAIMKRLRIEDAFSFDGDFRDAAAFRLWPDPKFEPRSAKKRPRR